MLILSRKPGESIVIDGRIIVRIMRLEGEVVKVGIDAPIDIPVHRQEVYDEIQKSNKEALTDSRTKLPRLAPGNTDSAASPSKGNGNHASQH
jgi:carbon storage regulator